MIKLALLASGNGTNAENIMRYFMGHSLIGIGAVITNNPEAKVISRAEKFKVMSAVFNNDQWENPSLIIEFLDSLQIDYIVLAGFLRLIHPDLVRLYPNKIINIHPALLPKYGGIGMYGNNVHRAVIASGDTTSGITIHMVDEHYDKGKIIFQASCGIEPYETIETLAKKVHELEYKHYPKVIENIIFPGN